MADSKADKDVVSKAQEKLNKKKPMTAAERKRLSRQRKRLHTTVTLELEPNVAKRLNEERGDEPLKNYLEKMLGNKA